MDFDYNVEKQEITVELNTPKIELDTPTGGRGLKGDTGNPGAKGDPGDPGTPGKDGEAATITVGSTTTGDAGTDASVTNSGTTSAAVLDFTIPKGDKGDTGDTGETGNGISSIEKTSTSGLVDTYTIYFTDGTTTTYTVTNGSGGGGSATDVQINGTSITSGGTANILTEGVYSASTNKIATMSDLSSKQDTLVSGTNIKTINNTSLLGSGNLSLASAWGDITGTLSNQTDLKNALDNKVNTSSLATVATTGDYDDLLDKPTIPSKTSDLNNDSGFIDKTVNNLTNYTLTSSLSTVATSGSYNDLTNKPTIPDELADLQDDTTHRVVTDSEKSTWSGKQDALVSGTNIKTINSTSLLGSGDISVVATETDPVYSASAAAGITSTDITNWNAKADMGITEVTGGSIRIWGSETGMYYLPKGTLIYYAGESSMSHYEDDYGDTFLFINKRENGPFYESFWISGDLYHLVTYQNSYGGLNRILDKGAIKNTLTETSSYGYALDARQGKVLKDLIDAIKDGVSIDSFGDVETALGNKQDTLVSGTNIKTINSTSLLGSGDISISSGASNLENGTGTGSLKSVGASLAAGDYSFAEGRYTTANSSYSHVEGNGTTTNGSYSHAEGLGSWTAQSGGAAHAEGYYTTARGYSSHSEGYYTEATSMAQHVQGKFNIVDSSGVYADIVGNGTDENTRSNAYTLDWSGNGVYAGKVTVGTGPTNNMDVATKQYVDSSIPTNVSAFTNDSGYVTDAVTGDLTNLTTTTKTNLVSAVNEVNDKDFICCVLTSQQNITTTGETKVKLNSVLTQRGSGFTFANNVVTCNFNGYIEVSGQIQFSNATNTNTHNIYIRQNDSTVARALLAAYTNVGNKMAWITPIILQVSNGDVIKMDCYAVNGDNLNAVANSTNMTIRRL